MSHITVLCVADDCTSTMQNLTGSFWDYVDYDNDHAHKQIDGVPIDDFVYMKELKEAWRKNPQAVWEQIGAVVEYGEYRAYRSAKELEETIFANDDRTCIKLYDVHQ